MRPEGMTSPPPAIPGVSEGVPQIDPLKMLGMMLGQSSGVGTQHLLTAITALRSAARSDPRLQDQVAEALKILTQGGSAEDSDDNGEPDFQP